MPCPNRIVKQMFKTNALNDRLPCLVMAVRKPSDVKEPQVPTQKRKRGRGADTARTKRELIDAAAASLIEDGYRGTTARAIAARAECNQAAIYYHFGGIDALLTQALIRSSEERLDRYTSSLREDESLPELVGRLEALYREDHDSGHFTLLVELIAGTTASPDLRDGIEATTKPWLDFVESRVQHAAAGFSFGALLPARDIADLVLSVVLGIELRNRIDGNADRSDRLFRLAGLVAGLVKTNP